MLGATSFVDVYGNRCRRLMLPQGASTLSFDALATVSPDPDPVPGPSDVQHRDQALPDELLHTRCSRAASASQTCSRTGVASCSAAFRRGGARAGGLRLIHANVEYALPERADHLNGGDFERRGGMCRDFAYLGVTFCRALGIPARYVFGYMPDIGIPALTRPSTSSVDRSLARVELVELLDARFNTPRIGRLAIGRGRDAVDVADRHDYGAASLRRMTVSADEVSDDAERMAGSLEPEAPGDG